MKIDWSFCEKHKFILVFSKKKKTGESKSFIIPSELFIVEQQTNNR